jgi:hypothetical protein
MGDEEEKNKWVETELQIVRNTGCVRERKKEGKQYKFGHA